MKVNVVVEDIRVGDRDIVTSANFALAKGVIYGVKSVIVGHLVA